MTIMIGRIKRCGIFCAFLCVLTCFSAVECQMLLPEAERRQILGSRHYPPSSRKRISEAAIRDGYAALDRKDCDAAMEEFNRAWRFDPKNPNAYWGAAIVFGVRAVDAKTPSGALPLIEASLTLFKKAEKYLPDDTILRENWQFDYAASWYVSGDILSKTDKAAAEERFRKAEKIWLSLLANRDLRNERDKKVYCRACMHLIKLYEAWGKNELRGKYFQMLSEEIRKDPSLLKSLQLY